MTFDDHTSSSPIAEAEDGHFNFEGRGAKKKAAESWALLRWIVRRERDVTIAIETYDARLQK